MEVLTLTNIDKTMVQNVFNVVFKEASLKLQKHILKMWAGVKMEYTLWLELLKRLARDSWLVPGENAICLLQSLVLECAGSVLSPFHSPWKVH